MDGELGHIADELVADERARLLAGEADGVTALRRCSPET